jgi:hypothetical protein
MASPKNIISFKNDTACVVFFPFAPELTESEKKMIDTAPLARFFVYGCSDAPVPRGVSGIGKLEDYPIESLKWAIGRRATTYISPEILDRQQPRDTPQALTKALMGLAAATCSDEHRSAVLFVTDRSFNGDDRALYRPGPSTPGNESSAARGQFDLENARRPR